MILLPLAGSLALSLTTFMEKLGLRVKRISPTHFVTAVFIVALILMIPFMFFFGHVNNEIFETKNLLIFVGIVVAGILTNILYYEAIKWEKISQIAPINLMQPLFVVLLAFAIFPSERNWNIIIPAVIAASALLFSHVKKHHLNFSKYALIALFANIIGAVEIILIKEVLYLFTPLSMYFYRSLFITLFFMITFRPNILKEIRGKERWIVLVTGFLWVAFRVLSFYGYLQLGVVFTTLILMLAPIFLYFLAWKFLKEKLDWRNIVAAAFIIAAVLYAILI